MRAREAQLQRKATDSNSQGVLTQPKGFNDQYKVDQADDHHGRHRPYNPPNRTSRWACSGFT